MNTQSTPTPLTQSRSKQTRGVCGPRAGVLARYQYSPTTSPAAVSRVLVLRDGGDTRQLWDEPHAGRGDCYLIEPAVHVLPEAERDAIVAEYLRHACTLGHPPMLTSLLAALERPSVPGAIAA